jgi:hypothetical protein
MRYNFAQLLQRIANQWRKGDCRGIGASGFATAIRAWLDVIMLGMTSVGARERTLQEFQELAKTAGFASVSVVVSIDFLSVLELNKA